MPFTTSASLLGLDSVSMSTCPPSPKNPGIVDEGLSENILRDSCDPGAAGVIAAGGKLPFSRSVNEMLGKFGVSGSDERNKVYRVIICGTHEDTRQGARPDFFRGAWTATEGELKAPTVDKSSEW